MKNGRYLLDTNIVIAFLKGEKKIVDHFASAEELYLSVVTLGELLYGARNSKNVESNIQKIKQFSSYCVLLPVSGEVAEHYSKIKINLKNRGKPIPENDIWIAATSIQNGLVLISRDPHFEFIKNITLEKW
ncbi:MAG: type II toxin-antitoxin system VapC family toxin [Candidatus Aminicenantia bacterium]